MIIRIRDDDVVGPEGDPKSWEQGFGRFKQIHEWIKEHPAFVHVAGCILDSDPDKKTGLKGGLLNAPDYVIDYMKAEVNCGKLIPEIHGLKHIDYGKLTKEQVKAEISYCHGWLTGTFGYSPKIWYTPWGASQPHLHEAAKELGLQLIDVSKINKLQGQFGVCRRLMDGESIDFLDGMEIFMHYWEGGARLKRVVESVKHGSWEAAANANRQLFK